MNGPLPEPRTPAGPSDEEINRITLDPVLTPFGGGNALFRQITTPLPARVAFMGSAPQRSTKRIELKR
jgi:hypothetical protein